MKKIFLSILLTGLFIMLMACGKKYAAAPTEDEVLDVLQQETDFQLEYYREKLGYDDLKALLSLTSYEVISEANKDSNGLINYNVCEILYCETLLQMIEDKTLTQEMIEMISTISFGYDDLTCNGYQLSGYSILMYPIFIDLDGNEYVFKDSAVLKNGDIFYLAKKTEMEPETMPDKPYVGMSGDWIDKTGLGEHDKIGHNTKKYADEPPAKKHECTLYYWMEDGRCIFIARVQDDINEVINIEENPAGSYFGN